MSFVSCIVFTASYFFRFLIVKVEEFRDTIQPEYLPWVAQYLVMKRVSIEPNFHDLYVNFLHGMNNGSFFEMVLSETYRNIKVWSEHV